MFSVAVMSTDISSMEFFKSILMQDNEVLCVRLFTDGEEYLKATLSGQFNIAFIYVGKRYVNGMSLAKKTKKMSPGTRIVLISETEDYANMAFDEGAWGYIIMPADEEKVKKVLKNITTREKKREQLIGIQRKI